MTDTHINQDISMEGSQADVNIAAGDLNIINYKPEFFSPSLDDYDDECFISPTITGALVEIIMKERLLILGGDGYDKSAFPRHIAWRVLNRCTGMSIEVKEWAGSRNPQNLELHIQKEKNPTIFILPDISPLNVDYDLSVLYRTVNSRKHYVIISTNQALEKWKLLEEIKNLSWEPDLSESLYDSRDLNDLLIKKLSEAGRVLPDVLKDKEFKAEAPLIGGLLLRDAAEKLKTPDSIDVFVTSLTAVNTPVSESSVRELLENCSSDIRAVRQWFYRSLSDREQLIALGLCLFEGLYDDQFFAAMEALVEQSWHKRDSSLQSLDYCDLDALSNYFRLNPLPQEGVQRVESHLTEHRQKILEIVWNSHRRQIYAALPVLEKFVKNSVSYSIMHQELYGTYNRRRLLREVMGEAFCNISLKPAHSIQGALIEGTLLRLAAEENLGVQIVVAQAMARWRYYDQDDKLFNTLQRWQHDKIMKILKSFLDVRYSENSRSPKIFIKATVALTVAFAAPYDPPNQLDPKLCDLLKKLAEDASNRFIYLRFANYTLPMAVRFHASQLRDILYDMAGEHYLNEPIGAALAAAVREGAEAAAEILDAWFRRCEKERPTRYAKKEVSHREAVMATVAYAYGWMEYRETDGVIRIEEGFQRLKSILRGESGPHVRRASIRAIIRQMVLNFEKVEQYLKRLFSTMHDNERTSMVNELAAVHLDQRGKLENGDEYFTWEQKLFPIWIHGKRPLTTVERVMQKWLKESDSEKASQIALEFEFSDKLIDFQEQEEAFVNRQKENWAKAGQPKPGEELPTRPIFGAKKEHRFLIGMAAWLAAFPQQKHREKIRWLLPVAMKKGDARQEKIRFALKKLYKYTDGEINTISDKLALALTIIKHKAVLFPALAGGLILLVVIAALALS